MVKRVFPSPTQWKGCLCYRSPETHLAHLLYIFIIDSNASREAPRGCRILGANDTIHAIKIWLQMVKLGLPDEKMEAVLITNRKKTNTVKIQIGNQEVVSAIDAWRND